ncbi:AAEL000519-PA [Aedes aegypti]|uniref:AAEL000519-PA n=1 Tax=Aedes aegypti TaxID=7159 RepID=Q17P05_AEDAE|nr:AAEL000519-PA [Aedes aegypti]
MNALILTFALFCAGASAQIYLNQPIALALQHQPVQQEVGDSTNFAYSSVFALISIIAYFHRFPKASLAHPAVVENALNEAQYPAEFRNNIYKNPHVAEALAKESWFGDKEMPVFERAADKIPRERILKIFKNAGFVRRR